MLFQPRRRLLAGSALALTLTACAPSATTAPPPTAEPTVAVASKAPATAAPSVAGDPGAVLAMPNSLYSSPFQQQAVAASAFGAVGWEQLRGPKSLLAGQLAQRDLTTSDARTVFTFDFTHATSQVTAGQDRVAWVETWRDKPSPSAGQVGTCEIGRAHV